MKNSILLTLFFVISAAFCAQVESSQQPIILPLWENGAPGSEEHKNIPEQAKDWWVKSVHNPSISVFQADESNGAAVLIFPGGGHRQLVFDEEGTKAAKFLNQFGITAAVVKYRLFREPNSPYTIEHPKQDAIRSLRLLRANAKRFAIDPSRIGLMGFSAGGEVVNAVAYHAPPANIHSSDPIETFNANVSFHIQIYPGPIGIPEQVSANAPPVFLLASNKDSCCSESIFKLLKAYREAGASVEAHFFDAGDHGFNMGNRSQFKSIQTWPNRLSDWLIDKNFFKN
ncbi:alpha/beta hydrolase [Paraglaciecola sp.]|uniref:alpha/beta hydrolase n=1 Tax=Paraglaciecola sp. TaxID=1920173 RepID=UPI003EF1B526